MKESIPISTIWFSNKQIHYLEKKSFPEFFVNNLQRTPDKYKYIRNQIISLCESHSQSYISASECLNHISGDCCDIIRIHSFLEHWGIINFSSDIMNHKFDQIFPLDETNQTRCFEDLIENELDSNWEQQLKIRKELEQNSNIGKMDSIEWISSKIEQNEGEKNKDNEWTKLEVSKHIISIISKKKTQKCSLCNCYLGIKYWRKGESVCEIINLALGLSKVSEDIKIDDLIEEFQKYEKSLEKFFKKIIKKEKNILKYCLTCIEENNQNLNFDLKDFKEVYTSSIITQYKQVLKIKESNNRGVDENIVKSNILKIIKKNSNSLAMVLQSIPENEKKIFLMEYLKMGLKDLKGIRPLLKKNFTFFHSIAKEKQNKNLEMSTIQNIIQEENKFKNIDSMLRIISNKNILENNLNKRNFDEFETDQNSKTEYIITTIKERAYQLFLSKKQKIIEKLKNMIYFQLNKLNKKINYLEEYEKFLLNEEIILKIRQNEILIQSYQKNNQY